MNLEEIKELLSLMRKHRISEIDLEQGGDKIRIVAESPRVQAAPAPAPVQPAMPAQYYFAPPTHEAHVAAPAPMAAAPVAAPVAAEKAAEPALPSNLIEIKSPMPGTFYRAPAPDAPSYVEVGSVINRESVLCIIEAMKLMNEVKSEVSGKIVKVLVENAQPIEYGQPLFLVEPA